MRDELLEVCDHLTDQAIHYCSEQSGADAWPFIEPLWAAVTDGIAKLGELDPDLHQACCDYEDALQLTMIDGEAQEQESATLQLRERNSALKEVIGRQCPA